MAFGDKCDLMKQVVKFSSSLSSKSICLNGSYIEESLCDELFLKSRVEKHKGKDSKGGNRRKFANQTQ